MHCEIVLDKVFFSDYALIHGLCRADKDDSVNELRVVMDHLRRKAPGTRLAVLHETQVTRATLEAFSQDYPRVVLVTCDEHMTYSVYLRKT